MVGMAAGHSRRIVGRALRSRDQRCSGRISATFSTEQGPLATASPNSKAGAFERPLSGSTIFTLTASTCILTTGAVAPCAGGALQYSCDAGGTGTAIARADLGFSFTDQSLVEVTMPSETVNVRYLVADVSEFVSWYTRHLGFVPITDRSPAFADVRRGALRLLSTGLPVRRAVRCLTASGRGRAAGTEFT